MIKLDDRWAKALTNNDSFLIIGRVGMDLYPLPDGTQIERAEEFKTDIGGSAGNIAVALVKAGQKAGLLSSVSDDAIGQFVRYKMQDYGVDMQAVGIVGGTARTSLALAETRPTKPEVVIYRNGAADLYLDQKRIDALSLSSLKAVIITGTALSHEAALDQLLSLCEKANKVNCPIILDVDYRASAWQNEADARDALQTIIPKCDIIIGNDDEFAVIAGNGIEKGYQFAKDLGQRQQLIIYKKGEKGCEAFFKDASLSVGIFAVTIKKPFGAGDAFLGNLFARLVVENDLEKAITRGAAAAAYVVSRSGCASAMPTTDELDNFITSFSTH